MNPKVQDFKGLIHWIADTHHGGAVHPIHARLGVSPALVQLWAKGSVKNPSLDYLERLCTVYTLDFWFVRSLLKRSRAATPIAGGSDADAPLGHAPRADWSTPYRKLRDWLALRWAPSLHPQWA